MLTAPSSLAASPVILSRQQLTGVLKKLAPAAKEPINYHSISNLALLVLREGACKRVAEQPPSRLHGHLLSETAQWTQCSAKGPAWPWWVFSPLFCGFFGQWRLVCFSSSFDSDWVEANGWHLCWEFRPTPWGPSLNSNGTPSDYFRGFSHKLFSFPGKKRPWNCLHACHQEGNANDNHSNSVYSLLCSRCFS